MYFYQDVSSTVDNLLSESNEISFEQSNNVRQFIYVSLLYTDHYYIYDTYTYIRMHHFATS